MLGPILGTVKTLKVDAGKNSSISSSIIWRMTLLRPVSLGDALYYLKDIVFTIQESRIVQVKMAIIFVM